MRIILFLVSWGVLAQAAVANPYFDRYKAEKINGSVYVIHGPTELPNASNRGFMNNPAFIVGKKSVVVVDPGSSHETGSMLLREIAKVTKKPVSHVINTHIHGDHWLANEIIQQKYPKVQIIADPRMIKKAKDGAAQTWVDTLMSLTKGATKGTKIAYPDTAVANGQSLKLAGLTFNFYSVGIAHSDSDVMIEYVQGSTFFTGDNAGHQRILRLDDGHFKDSIKALDKAIKVNAKHYVPGHGPSGGVEVVKLQREYLDTLYKQVEIYYEEGLEDFEMKPKVSAALKKFHKWVGFDDELGKHISLAKLQIEQAEFE